MRMQSPSSSRSDRPVGGDIGAPPLIVGIGEILWDILPDGRQLGGAPAKRIAGYVYSRNGAWPDLPAELSSWP